MSRLKYAQWLDRAIVRGGGAVESRFEPCSHTRHLDQHAKHLPRRRQWCLRSGLVADDAQLDAGFLATA